MKLRRIGRDLPGNFRKVSNDVIKCRDLSLEAIGFLVWIMDLSDTWDFSVAGTQAALGIGRQKVYSLIDELINAGFAKRERTYKNGRVEHFEYIFTQLRHGFDGSETGLLSEKTKVEKKLLSGKLKVGKLNAGLRTQSKTQSKSKDSSETKSLLLRVQAIGVSDEEARSLITKFGETLVEAKLTLAKGPRITNPDNYLRAALDRAAQEAKSRRSNGRAANSSKESWQMVGKPDPTIPFVPNPPCSICGDEYCLKMHRDYHASVQI
jgi:hypothetical protein